MKITWTENPSTGDYVVTVEVPASTLDRLPGHVSDVVPGLAEDTSVYGGLFMLAFIAKHLGE